MLTTHFGIRELRNVSKIILGNLLLGFAYAKWMKPDGIINGGVTSISMIFEKITGIPIFYLTTVFTRFITNLLALSWKRKFLSIHFKQYLL
nr:YitT family protein [Vagococcus zengguangii]